MRHRASQPAPSHASRVNGPMNINVGGRHHWMQTTGSMSGQMASIQVFAKSILRHVISAAGYTKQLISSTLCPKAHSLKPKRRYMKSGRQRLKSMRRKPLNSSLKPIRINIQRPPFRYRKIVKSYWPFMISLPNTGRVYEPATRLNPPLVP